MIFLIVANIVTFQGKFLSFLVVFKLRLSLYLHSFEQRYRESDGHMTMIRLNTFDDIETLPRTKWNIPQPSENDKREDCCLQSGGLDLILTPGLAFSKEGCRLGRGKGFYDNFIKNYSSLHKPPYLIGLALTPSIVDYIPCTENDVKMNEIIYAAPEQK